MNITIVGGGNVGTQLAVHSAEKNNNVIIFTSKPEKFSKELKIINENDELIHVGKIKCATNNEEEAFNDADLIFVTTPAFVMKDSANKILPYVKKGMKICLVPGTGGGECAFKKCMEKGAVIFGIQRVPSVARLVEYGKVVRAIGYREELFVSSLPKKYIQECTDTISALLNIKTTSMPNYLNITLTPSNPILHTSRLRTIFKDYKKGVEYDRIPLFYEEWNDESSKLLFKCDDEVQKICNKINTFDLSYVKSLKDHYESDTPEKLTKKIQSIRGFRGLETPYVKLENGKLIPDLNSRYFTADFSYGLKILVDISELFGLKSTNLREILNWYYEILDYKPNEFDFSHFNIKTSEDFIDFYSI